METTEKTRVSDMKHLCYSCTQIFATCFGNTIVWGADIDPDAVGENIDKVCECDGYCCKG